MPLLYLGHHIDLSVAATQFPALRTCICQMTTVYLDFDALDVELFKVHRVMQCWMQALSTFEQITI